MSFIADAVFDSGLSYAQTNGTRLDICSSEPTTYAAATSTATLGNSTSPPEPLKTALLMVVGFRWAQLQRRDGHGNALGIDRWGRCTYRNWDAISITLRDAA